MISIAAVPTMNDPGSRDDWSAPWFLNAPGMLLTPRGLNRWSGGGVTIHSYSPNPHITEPSLALAVHPMLSGEKSARLAAPPQSSDQEHDPTLLGGPTLNLALFSRDAVLPFGHSCCWMVATTLVLHTR